MAIDLYRGDDLGRARRWADLDPPTKRREAMRAANDKDVAALWNLCQSYLVLHGSSGANVSPKTLRSYSCSIRQFIDYAGGLNLCHIRPDDAAIWLRTLERAGKAPSTVAVRLAGIRALYRALRWAGAVSDDPFADARPARDKTNAADKRRPYPDGDILKMLTAADAAEDRALILTLAHAGLRISEALALEREDIDLESRRLTVRHGKGGKRRTVTISKSLAEALWWLFCEVEDGRLFSVTTDQGARKRLRKLCQLAGVTYRAAHSLRHSAGTRLMTETRDLDRVARHLGHQQLETSRIYTAFADELLANTVGTW